MRRYGTGSPTPKYPWAERDAVRKDCCAQEHSTDRDPARAWSRISPLAVQRTNHKVIAPPLCASLAIDLFDLQENKEKYYFLRFILFMKIPFDNWLDSLKTFLNCHLNYLLNFLFASKTRFIKRFIKFYFVAVDIVSFYQFNRKKGNKDESTSGTDWNQEVPFLANRRWNTRRVDLRASSSNQKNNASTPEVSYHRRQLGDYVNLLSHPGDTNRAYVNFRTRHVFLSWYVFPLNMKEANSTPFNRTRHQWLDKSGLPTCQWMGNFGHYTLVPSFGIFLYRRHVSK